MNKNMLRSVMALHGDKGNDIAKTLGISRTRFSDKINEKNGAQFTQREIEMIRNRYSLSATELELIFFDRKVS